MAQSGRTIRVYVSSTFRDMHAERDYLHKIVFPELRERIAALNLNLVVVDQRCDVSEDKADIDLAFKEIDQSTFFIGILGERYGLIPDKIPENTLIQYPWLKNYSGHSVTALEILHALHTPNLSNHCFFYFRDSQKVSEVLEARRSGYVAEDHEETLKLKELKDKIRASGCPALENYPCQWDDQKRCLVGLELFGQGVLNDLWQAIDELYRNIEVENVSIIHNIEFGVKEKSSQQPLYLDEKVQFTVYRPKKIQPVKWYPLLTFAHLSERPPDAKEDEPDPIKEVQKQAKQILGEQVDNYANLIEDIGYAVPRQGEITLVPEAPGIEFNPPRRSFLWTEGVHKEEFRIRASLQLDGKMAKGRISVFLSGSIILAEITLKIEVDSREQHKTSSIPYEHTSSDPYRRIFTSYSHKDLKIVELCEGLSTVGDEYLRDLVHIRAGEVWDERLIQMISQADIFQLYWSWNSIRSKFVEREWRYALSLKRSQFVRPVYWEDPRPELKEENLPPEELQKLHFKRLPINSTSVKYLQEQGNQEQLKRSTKQGKKIAKTIPGTSKTTNPSRKKTLRNSMFICLPIVFIGGLVIGIYQYMDFSVRKANTTLEEINGIASKNELHQLLQNRTMNLLCQKGIDPEEIESTKQIEGEEPGSNINIAKKEEIISGGGKLSENTPVEIIRKHFGVPVKTEIQENGKIVSDLKDFQRDVSAFEKIISDNTIIKNEDIRKAKQKITVASTDAEMMSAYSEYTDAIAGMIVNDKRAEESLNKALGNLQDAPKWFQKGDEVNDALGNTLKTYAADITSLYLDIENAISDLASSDPTSIVSNEKDKEFITEIREFYQEMYADFKEQNKELFTKLEIIKNEGVNTNSVDTAIGDIRSTLGYYKDALAFARTINLIEFKKAAAVGKVRCLQDRLANLMEGVFQGLPVDDYLEGIHSDQYDTNYINNVMLNDLGNSRLSTMGTHTIGEKVIKKLNSLRKVPKPGSVSDGNPNHKYFFDKDKDRWYWIDANYQGNIREALKNYAPFDYEAGTGKYIKYKDGKWYSYAPIYNGAEVEIFPDTELVK